MPDPTPAPTAPAPPAPPPTSEAILAELLAPAEPSARFNGQILGTTDCATTAAR